VDNWPADADGVQGPELMERFRRHAERFGTEIVFDHIHTAKLQGKQALLAGDQATYTCDALIIATGASAKYLGLPSEKHFQGFGVSACATCDGFFYKNKRVAVVGGGNTAVEESLYLAQLASSVTLIHRRDTLRAEKMLQNRLMAHEKIKVVWDSVIEEVKGHDEPRGVTALKLRNVKTNAVSELPVDGLFIAIGHDPATSLFRGQLEMDSEGYIVTTPGSTATAIPGVFAAGDVQDKVFRQAVTAAGTGCMAALEAGHFLAAEEAHAAVSAAE